MSVAALNRTALAFGAKTRKVTRRSAEISGDTTRGGPCVRASRLCGTADSKTAIEQTRQTRARIDASPESETHKACGCGIVDYLAGRCRLTPVQRRTVARIDRTEQTVLISPFHR